MKKLTLRCPICTKPVRIMSVVVLTPEFIKEKDLKKEDLFAVVSIECMTCEQLIAGQVHIPAEYEIENEEWVDYSKLKEYLDSL